MPPRSLGTLAIATILALAATAFISCRPGTARDKLGRGDTESYPATYAVPLDAGAREVTLLDSALGSSAMGRRLARRYPTGTDSSMQALLKKPHQWSAIQLPPPIARLMKGVQVFLFHCTSGVTPTVGREFWRIHQIVAVKGDKLYALPTNLVALLEDCGVRFRREDVAAWIPAVAYMVVAGYRYPGAGTEGPPNRYAREDSIASGQAPLVPTLAISKTVADTAKTMSLRYSLLPGDIEEVRAIVQVAGETDTMFIQMDRSGKELYPNSVRWLRIQKLSTPWQGAGMRGRYPNFDATSGPMLFCTPRRVNQPRQVPRLQDVSLRVYNTAGRQVRTLIEGRQKPGAVVTRQPVIIHLNSGLAAEVA